jgi:hypothetical protein
MSTHSKAINKIISDFTKATEMKRLLWLDDIRDPFANDGEWLVFSPIARPYEVSWVKSYEEFTAWISEHGLPSAICFDHDLGLDEVHEKGTMSKRALKRHRKTPDYKTGYDCAKWLVDYCIDNELMPPPYGIQSANPVGRENIDGLLKNFIKHSS